MSKVRAKLITIGVMAGAAYAAYELLLNDQAKEELKRAIKATERSYQRIKEIVTEITGEVMDDDAPLPNVQATSQQWENIGY
ncbi:MAG: hypothetical protein ACOYJL_08550 [Tractidigestivibacter sp.]|jgi:hypothetical protein|uniref:hypothetical protein n=1 Tax=Tractidigestivibacter sp. TaxID=2847320 RepID=UPI003D8C933C